MIATKFAVTFSKEGGGDLPEQARLWARDLQVPYLPRYEKGSLDDMLREHKIEALLIASRRGPRVYTAEGMFFYHPGMGTVRWQRVVQRGEADNFLKALAIVPGQRVLDCTLGLAADALLASHAVGKTGLVVGLEASPLLYFLTSRGIRSYPGKFPALTKDLRRIRVVQAEAGRYLKEQPDDSFDVVYFDPMFRIPVKKSSAMAPLRPLAYEKRLSTETVRDALRVAPRVVIKERSEEILKEYGCTAFIGTRYSAVHFGILERNTFCKKKNLS